MPHCELIWYVGEPYREAVARANELAQKHGQTVTLLDASSGRAVKYVTPNRGFYEARRWK